MSETTDFTQAYSQASDAFTKFVPGFEFLQGLVKNAGKALPSMGQWVAPTLDPAELERRIEELKTVQFWLEQNARMLGATIQALEVQRMTLGTLKGMNVSLGDLSEALKMRVPDMFTGMAAAAESATQAATQAASASARAAAPAPAPAPEPAAAGASAGDDGATGPVDAMQWWGALTQQFTQLASQAIQATSDAARQASEATSDAANQASQAVQAATAAAAEAAAEAAKPMTDAVNEAVSQSVKAAKTVKAATAAPAASPAKPRAAAKKATATRAKPADAAAAPKAARRRAS